MSDDQAARAGEMVRRIARILKEQSGYRGGIPGPEELLNARAILKAMREPTEAMLEPSYFDQHRNDDAAEIWRMMIDEALKDG